jgi:ferrous iron transport protein B
MIGLYASGMIVGVLVALLLKGTAFRGQPVPFVMELPNYRMPSLKNVFLLLWEKAKDFLERAFTIILIASVAIWFLQTFDYRLNVVVNSADSLLAMIGRGLAPVFRPLGFEDWRVATSLITGLIAKEAVVSTLSVLLGTGVAQLHLALPTLFTTLSAVSFLLFTLLYTPCVAAVATIRKELRSGWATLGVVVLQCVVAWIVAYAAYLIGGLFL